MVWLNAELLSVRVVKHMLMTVLQMVGLDKYQLLEQIYLDQGLICCSLT